MSSGSQPGLVAASSFAIAAAVAASGLLSAVFAVAGVVAGVEAEGLALLCDDEVLLEQAAITSDATSAVATLAASRPDERDDVRMTMSGFKHVDVGVLSPKGLRAKVTDW